MTYEWRMASSAETEHHRIYPLVTTLWPDFRLLRQSVKCGLTPRTRTLQECFDKLSKTSFLHFREFCLVKLRVIFS